MRLRTIVCLAGLSCGISTGLLAEETGAENVPESPEVITQEAVTQPATEPSELVTQEADTQPTAEPSEVVTQEAVTPSTTEPSEVLTQEAITQPATAVATGGASVREFWLALQRWQRRRLARPAQVAVLHQPPHPRLLLGLSTTQNTPRSTDWPASMRCH